MTSRTTFVVLAIAVLMLRSLGAVEASPNTASSDGCTRDLGKDVSALVNRAPVVLADIHVGSDGRTHPMLAQALGVGDEGRTQNESGLELPSPVEDELGRQFVEHPCFRAFERIVQQGTEDVSGVNRAVMQVEMPFADYQELTVQYAPGKFRRNHLFQISYGFELRDADGKVVFARSYADNYRRTCFWEGAAAEESACLDLQDAPVDAVEEWRALIKQSVGVFLASISSDIGAWRSMLADLRGEFLDRRYSQDRDVDALQVRKREQLALPYLFVQTPTPRVNVKGLLAGLGDRGYAVGGAGVDSLQNHFNILFRSYLDRSMQSSIANLDDAANARIVLLSDAQSVAFENATMISCADQSRAFNREDCLAPVKLIERLCDADSPDFGQHRNPRGDICVLSSLAFGRSLTRTNEQGLSGVRDAQQRIQAAAYLRPADEPRSTTRVGCVNPETQKMAGHIVGASDNYLRIDDAGENDDAIYLVDAAVDAIRQQADCLAASLVDRYQEMRHR